ncbi:hypothetical protein EGW08_005392 [Elysia chlorotica]|uniref:Small monomeric GTPase n=1 Tax=Elysia chlorotica TaxID=188477 RepID=A0A433TZ80_ELYCH|nr:hypothetical protein EGW08_005392 [Elysia chlorotica]
MTIDLQGEEGGGPDAVLAASDHGVETLLMAQRLRDAGRTRMGSNDSENSAGSGRSGDSRTLHTPGINLIPGSAPGSRASSFREKRALPSSSSSSSRRSPTPRPHAGKGGTAWRGADASSGNLSNASSNSQNNHNHHHDNNNKDNSADEMNLSHRRSSMPNVAENFLSVPQHHGSSSPADRDSKLRRVRSFKTTSKGVVVNRGDSFKKKSTHSLMSTGSAITEATRQLQQQQQQQQLFLYQQQQHQQHLLDSSSPYFADVPAPTPTYYRVIMMGSADCGKSQMTKQFMTSDYFDGYEDAQESHENTVSVLLDGEESTIEFIDPPDRNVIQEGLEQLLDAYIVVFAINDHGSFEVAQDLIRYLRVENGTDRVIVLVANKIDLVRKRKVSADEARLVAETYDCKYTEASAALNHYMDELLVGVLTQIRLHMRIPFTTISFPGKDQQKQERKERKRALRGPGGFFSRLFRRASRKKTKPCENLYIL